jgi:hypothetical protein
LDGIGFSLVAQALRRRVPTALYRRTEHALNIAPFPRDWASDIRHGLDLRGGAYVNAHAIYKIIVSPALALLAIAAARFDRHPAAATVAVVLPTIVDAAGVAAFAISVFMYGF